MTVTDVVEAAQERIGSARFSDVLLGQRAVRRIRSAAEAPVPRQLLVDCVQMAVHAPSGSNRQHWGFVLVEDPAKKRAIAELNHVRAVVYASNEVTPLRLREEVLAAADRMADVPWLVVPCYEFPADALDTHNAAAGRFGSIFPAVQNFLLACHAMGLGASLTTMSLYDTPALSSVLGLPDGVRPCALIPVGWPMEPVSAPRRRPVEHAVFVNDYQHPLAALD